MRCYPYLPCYIAYKAIAFILLVPYLMTLVYLFINPISTLMMADRLMEKPVIRIWVPLKKISPHLVNAVVASEDDAFCSHFGMDFNQLEKSIRKAEARGQPVKGTSTISQQLAKNLFLWNGRSILRKILEVPLTIWLELLWSKKQILEAYLNVAEWGNGIYGIEAASQHYFGIPAKNLSYGQSALLATSLPNPIDRSARRPSPGHSLIAMQLLKRLNKSRPDLSCIR